MTWVPRQRVIESLLQADAALGKELAEALPDTVDVVRKAPCAQDADFDDLPGDDVVRD